MKKYSVIKESETIKKYDYCVSEQDMWKELESHTDRFPEILFTSEDLNEALSFFKSIEASTNYTRDYMFDFEIVYLEEENEDERGFISSSIRYVNCVEFFPITIKTYSSNVELFAGNSNHTIYITEEHLSSYFNSDYYGDADDAIEDATSDFRSELEQAFPNCHSEVIEEALTSVMNVVEMVIASHWEG